MHHSTTTFELSEAIQKLLLLSEKIEHASFVPQEELLALLIAGSMVIDTIVRSTDTTMFTEEEVTFITILDEQISDEFVAITGNAQEGWQNDDELL